MRRLRAVWSVLRGKPTAYRLQPPLVLETQFRLGTAVGWVNLFDCANFHVEVSGPTRIEVIRSQVRYNGVPLPEGSWLVNSGEDGPTHDS